MVAFHIQSDFLDIGMLDDVALVINVLPLCDFTIYTQYTIHTVCGSGPYTSRDAPVSALPFASVYTLKKVKRLEQFNVLATFLPSFRFQIFNYLAAHYNV